MQNKDEINSKTFLRVAHFCIRTINRKESWFTNLLMSSSTLWSHSGFLLIDWTFAEDKKMFSIVFERLQLYQSNYFEPLYKRSSVGCDLSWNVPLSKSTSSDILRYWPTDGARGIRHAGVSKPILFEQQTVPVSYQSFELNDFSDNIKWIFY